METTKINRGNDLLITHISPTLVRCSVHVPVYLQTAKRKIGKKYRLNLNNYNKWKSFKYNDLKSFFQKLEVFQVLEYHIKQISTGPIFIDSMEYRIFFANRQSRDRSNIVSMIRKFFEDSLIVNKIIKDDNDDYIGDVSDKASTFGAGYDEAVVDIVISGKFDYTNEYRLKTLNRPLVDLDIRSKKTI